MADSKELQNQLQIQQAINKAIADRAALLSSQQKALSAQAQIAVELCKALECKELDQVAARLDEINSGLNDAAGAADAAASGVSGTASAIGEAGDAANETSSSFGEMVKNIDATDAAAAGAASGMIKGFKSAGASVKMMIGTLGAAAKGIMNVGKAILSAPFKILGGLTKMASAGAGGVNELKQAMEETKGVFGDLATGEGKAVMDGFNNLTSKAGGLGQTGLSTAKVFGRGKAGLANALKFAGEFAEAAGASFHMLSGSMSQNMGTLAAMNKGLGMSQGALVNLTKSAQLAGKDVGSVLTETASMALQMGDKFGVSAKTIGKNMSSLMEDVKNFGGMSTKEFGAVATYMAKLGLEAKDLQGVISKFDNFEDAADSASQLNQAFGMQIDAMEMMNAENPAERIDMMRDAFHAAGKDIDSMTRQEKSLLAAQTGLSEEALASAFSVENMGTSYADLEAGAEEAEENSLSQEEAMSKLADSITTLTEGGGSNIDSFFGAFTDGFMKGMKQGEGFKEMLGAIRNALKIVQKFGKAAGKMFSDLMGEMGVWDGIKDLFDPKDLQNLLGIDAGGGLTGTGLMGIFKKFKDALTGKGNYSPQQMADDMGKEFKKFFDAKGPAFAKLKKALISGIKMIGAFIAGLIPVIIGKMVDMIKGMAEALRNPDGLKDAASQGIGGAVIEALMGIGEAIMAALPSLISALIDLIMAAATNPTVLKIGGAILAFSFAKMMLMGVLAAAKAAIFQVVVKKLVGMMTGGVEKASKKAGKGKGAKSMGKSLKQGFSGFADGLKTFVERVCKIKPTDVLKAGAIMALMALSFLPTLAIFAYALVMVVKILMQVPIANLVMAIVALQGAIFPMIGLMTNLQNVKMSTVGKAMLGAIGAAAFMVVGLYAFALAVLITAPVVMAVGIANWVAVGIVGLFVGLAALGLAAAMPALAAVGSASGLLGNAMLGALAGALLLVVGVLAFSLAVAILGPVVAAVGLKNFGMVAIAMIGVAIAAVSLAVAAVALAVLALVALVAIPGAILAGALLAVLALVTVPALGMFYNAVSAVGMGEVAIAMLALLGIAWGLVFASTPFILGIVVFTLALVGSLMAAAFVGIGLVALGWALVKFQEAYSGIDLGVINAVFGNLIITFLALLGMGISAALIGVMTPVFIIGAIGLVVATGFIWAMNKTVAPALVDLMAKMGHIDGKNMMYIAIAIELAFNAIIRMATKAKGLIKYLWPGMMKKVRIGFGVFEDLAEAMVSSLVPSLKAIAQMPIGDPKMFMMKIDALLKIFDAVQDMGELVFKIALLDVLSGKGGDSGGVLAGATDFINAIFGGAKDLILALVRFVSVMKEGDIAKLEAIGGVLAAIGDLLLALQPPPALLDAIADLSKGGLFGGGDPEGAMDLLKSFGDTMKMMLEAVRANIPPMLKAILEVDVGPDPEAAKAKTEIVGAALDGVSKLVTAIGGAAGQFMEQATKSNEAKSWWEKSEPMGSTIDKMAPMFDMIMGSIRQHIPGIIKSVLAATKGIDDPKAAEAKVKIVQGAMEAVANFATAIGSFSELIPEDTGSWWPFGESADPLEQMMNTVSMIVSAIREHMGPLIKSVIGVKIDGDPAAILLKLCIIGKTMDAVQKFVGIISDLGSGGLEEGFAATVSIMMKEVANSIYWDGYWDLGDLLSALANVELDEGVLTKLDTSIAVMEKVLAFATAANEIVGQMQMVAEGGGFAAAVSEMVYQVNGALIALTNLAPIDANLALETFASALGTGEGSYTINAEPVNITLNVTVTMDANKVGKVLVDKSVMTTPLASANEGG